MRKITLTIKLLILALVFVSLDGAASAQEARAGLVIQTNNQVGVDFHVWRRFAVRPSVAFSRFSRDLPNSSQADLALTYGVSVPVTVARTGPINVYLAPAMSVEHRHAEGPLTDSTVNTWTVAGAFGIRYAMAHKLSLFGETGIARNFTNSGDIRARTLASTGTIGLILSLW